MSALDTRVVALLLACSLVAGTLPATVGAQEDGGPTEIESCGATITEPGTYVLTRDIIDDRGVQLSQSCISIESSDVVFDGGGHTIDGNGVSDTTGIAVENGSRLSNVTVRDVTVSDWNRGIHYHNVSGGEITDVNATLDAFGIVLMNTTGVAVRNPAVSDNLIGIFLNGSSGNTVEGVTAEGNMVAIKVDEHSENNTVPEERVQWVRRVNVGAELRLPGLHRARAPLSAY